MQKNIISLIICLMKFKLFEMELRTDEFLSDLSLLILQEVFSEALA